MRTRDPRAVDVIAEAQNSPVRGSPSYTLTEKIWRTKKALEAQNRDFFGNVKNLITEKRGQIESLQLQQQTEKYIKREAVIQQDLDKILKGEEILWRDKAKSNQLEDGDANTKYFQITTIVNRRSNHINYLRWEDRSWTDSWHKMGKDFEDYLICA